MGNPVKVSQLNSYIGRILATDPILGNISVCGEVSNLKFHSSGHVYFSLKDERSKVNCFLPAQNVPKLRYELEDDMEIVVHGYVSVFERGGTYSLTVRDIEVNGEGDLKVAFDKMRAKLEGEGIFDPNHKKPIPFFPLNIAIVTSDTGAAVRDITKIITSRNDVVDIMIYPVLVQGPKAAADIAYAIDDINTRFTDIDVIIAGRGGGSTEELWAFNEEIVARSIYKSSIPVISAVGHETDFTIADFAADLRAETPTAAAQIAAPDIELLKQRCAQAIDDINDSMTGIINYRELMLRNANPSSMGQSLLHRIDIMKLAAERAIHESDDSIMRRLDNLSRLADSYNIELEHYNPRNLLKHGYALIADNNGRIIRSITEVTEGSTIVTKLDDGQIIAEVTDIREERQ